MVLLMACFMTRSDKDSEQATIYFGENKTEEGPTYEYVRNVLEMQQQLCVQESF